ncbi:MAG: hypothetical protein AAF806_04895 [Bacteroidota bacterium]
MRLFYSTFFEIHVCSPPKAACKVGLEEKHNILLTAKYCVSPPNPPIFRRRAVESTE